MPSRAFTTTAVLTFLAVLALCHPEEAAAVSTGAPQRIVALVPSLVEDLCAIGGSRQLIGVSSATRDIPCARNAAIVGDFSSVDVEKIVAIHADLVVAIPAQAHLVEPLRRAGIRVELLADDSFANIFDNISALGHLTGRMAQAAALDKKLKGETVRLVAGRHFKRAPSVFVALGTGPIYTAGPTSYLSTLIELAGGRNAVTTLPGAYGEYSAEALLRLQPDAIVTDPAVGLDAVLVHEPWRSLRAVRSKRVFTLTDAALLERPGPRYNEGLRWLIERLTPLSN
ncbi:MAG: ABC transporter substrate-binding protein [Candidatus Eremiobacteraeota bacterium]|nr:ABC transporter substrate-binding protein [Candidatus Eremiobacteraeota bacterium]